MAQGFPILFSLEEANQQLDWLKSTMAEIQRARKAILKIKPEIEPVLEKAISNGQSHVTPQLLPHFRTIKSNVEEIRSRGIVVRDVNTGLVDFPSIMDGRIVLLCWQYGESSIGYWHEADSGYAGRKPL